MHKARLHVDFYHSAKLPLPRYSMALQTKSVVRKRRLDTPKAKQQQRDRRKRSLMKKAYEYSRECDADVYISIRIHKNGQVFTFNSDSTGEWPRSEAEMVSHSLCGEFLYHLGTLKRSRSTTIQSRSE
jgi:hypothetical protein